jgi:hypothetical protein
MKTFVKLVLAYIAIVLLLSVAIYVTLGGIIKTTEEFSDPVGTKVIVEEDTLLIIDSSFWAQNYTLSNGSKISVDLLEKLDIIE